MLEEHASTFSIPQDIMLYIRDTVSFEKISLRLREKHDLSYTNITAVLYISLHRSILRF